MQYSSICCASRLLLALLLLVAMGGRAAAETAPVQFTLPNHAVDAEFDVAHGRMILVSNDPPQLHRWSAGTSSLDSMTLPAAPLCVSISPDGSEAVVGHDGSITVVDLVTLTVSASWPCSVTAGDIVHGGQGFAHVFPEASSGNYVESIDLTTGTEFEGYSTSSRTRARLRPGSTAVYAADYGYYPDRVEHYWITSSGYLWEAGSTFGAIGLIAGDNLWFNAEGTRLLTSLGYQFTASDDRMNDLLTAGRMADPHPLLWADHGGAGSTWYATIATGDDGHIALISDDLLNTAATRALPAFATPGGDVPAHGRWVFLSDDGGTAYVLAQADAASGLINDQAIITIDLTTPPSVICTSPADGATLGGSFSVTFRTTAWPPTDGGSVHYRIDGVPRGAVTSPFHIAGIAPGDHIIVLELVDHLGGATGIADALTLHVAADRPGSFSLTGNVIDSEFDATHGQMILVSNDPPRLQRWLAGSDAVSSVDLPAIPRSVGISPDGSEAVIGHDDSITVVDLIAMTVSASWACSADAGDIVDGGNGFAYVFPFLAENPTIHAIDLASGAETASPQYISNGTQARRRPGPGGIYGAKNYVSPAGIERYGIAGNGTPSVERGSPDLNNYAVGGDLWFNDQGTRILSKAGNVFLASDDAATDMRYAGHVSPMGPLVWADHGGSGSGSYAAITVTDDTRIALFDGDSLALIASQALPAFSTLSGDAVAHGRRVFLSADGNTAYVVVQADTTSGLADGGAIITLDLTPQPGIAFTSPASGAILGSSFNATFRTAAWPPLAGGSVRWTVDGDLHGTATNPLPIAGLTPGDHTIRLELIDHLGTATGIADTLAIHATADQTGVVRLASAVVDSEFDPAHGQLVLVSSDPPQLQRWLTGSQSLAAVALPSAPRCVSISPDGSEAVVGHDGRITVVDLASLTVSASWSCSADAGDIVAGGDGFAYVFPARDQWVLVHVIDLASGAETMPDGYWLRAGARARLRPGLPALYSIGSEDFGLAHYLTSDSGIPTTVRFDPNWSNSRAGRNLWFNDQGTRVLTSAGYLFAASDDATMDMTLIGQLPGTGTVAWADHGGQGDGRYAIISTADDGSIALINADPLDLVATRALPSLAATGTVVSVHGRQVFMSADGNTAYVIAQADATGGLVNDQAIITVDLTPQPAIALTSPADGAVLGGFFTATFTATEWPPADGGAVLLSVDGDPKGNVTSPFDLSGLVPGEHAIRLDLVDHLGAPLGISSAIAIHVADEHPGVLQLPTDVVDAEFDAAHGQLVLVSSGPPLLQRWLAGSSFLTSVPLSAAPRCIGISPDGSEAVVGQDGRITVIDLISMTETASWPCTADAGDIIDGGAGFAYVLPASDQWVGFHTIDLQTGGETISGSLYAGSQAHLRPGTSQFYTVDSGVSNWLTHYDATGYQPMFVRHSSDPGTYGQGDLWFNDLGTRLLTRTGTLYQTTDDAATDLTYAGHVPGTTSLIWADHGGTGNGWYATIAATDDSHLGMVPVDRLDQATHTALPSIPTLDGPVAAHGRWVFLSLDGNTAYVIAQADPAGGLVNDQAIETIDLTPPRTIAITSPGDQAVLGGTFNVTYSTTGWPPAAGGTVQLDVDGSPRGPVASPFQVTGLAPGYHTIRLELVDSLGAADGAAGTVTIQVADDQPGAIRLTTAVVDAEFDAAHGAMILVSSDPPLLQRLLIGTGALTATALPAVPRCVSISPDGSQAVVGHDGSITVVDLATLVPIASWTCSTDAGDIVHGGNGFAYVFPLRDEVMTIHTIDLATGSETLADSVGYVGTQARLRPGASAIYGAENTSPSYLARYGIGSDGIPAGRRISPHWDIYQLGGNLWFNRQGTRILTRAGDLFQATDDASTDMSYAGHLPTGGRLLWADHGGPDSGWYATIDSADDGLIALSPADAPETQFTVALPDLDLGGTSVVVHGRWVFLSQDGTSAHVIVQADPGTYPMNHYAVMTLDLHPRLTDPGATVAHVGSRYSCDLASAETSALQITSSTLPSWLSVSGHVLSGVPTGVDSSGAISVTARNVLGLETTVTFDLAVLRGEQSLSFATVGDQVAGVAPIALSAVASSGLPVAFSVISGPATVSGSQLTITGTGTVVVAADQAGSDDYAAAPQVMQTITVAAPAEPEDAEQKAKGGRCGLGSGIAILLLCGLLAALARPQHPAARPARATR